MAKKPGPLKISVDVDTLGDSIASGKFKAWYAPAAATISQNGKSLGLGSSTLLSGKAFSGYLSSYFPEQARWTIVTGPNSDYMWADLPVPGLVTVVGGSFKGKVGSGYTVVARPGANYYEVSGDLRGNLVGANIPRLSRGDTIVVSLMDVASQRDFNAVVAIYEEKYISNGIKVMFSVLPNAPQTTFFGSGYMDNIQLDEGPRNKTLTIDGGAGDDVLSASRYRILGGDGNDFIISNGYSTIDGGAGADTIFATVGDVIASDDAADTVIVGTNTTSFRGLRNAKVIYKLNDEFPGYNKSTGMLGGRYDDTFAANTSGNTMTGRGGRDTFAISASGNVITDLDANDTVIVGYRATAREIVAWTRTGATVEWDIDDVAGTLAGFAGDDSITGDASGNTFSGMAGNDALDGGAGDDRLEGDTGSDTLIGATGNDTLMGGDGNDVLVGGYDVVRAEQRRDNDQLWGGAGDDSAYGGCGADTLFGETGNDLLDGGIGDDRIYGGDGADTLWGGAGNDALWGDDGNDVLYGGEGSDVLRGGNGNDTMSFSTGRDVVYGGAGNDLFVFTPSNEVGLSNIADFDASYDKLDLSSLSLVDGFSQASRRFAFNAGMFQIDLNGDGTFDQSFRLTVTGGTFDMNRNVVFNTLV